MSQNSKPSDPISRKSNPRPANIIGPRVRWMREKLRLTQDELAGKLARYGITLDYVKVGQIENGKRRVIDWELVAIAKALGVSITWLISGDEDAW
ncbi:MAG: helix-turn-helix domain-containing protein [Synechococcus sp.]